MEHLEAAIAARSGFVALFEESGIRHGRFQISCTDQRSYQWLYDTIGNITVLSQEHGLEDFHLYLVTPAEVPKLVRAEVYITGTPPTVPNFCMTLRAQNSGLHTDRWLLCHQQSTDHGMFMVWGTDMESANALASKDDRPDYGFGRIAFRVSHGPDPGGTSQQ